MHTSTEELGYDVDFESNIRDDFLLQLKSSKFNGILKLRKSLLHYASNSNSIHLKRSRECFNNEHELQTRVKISVSHVIKVLSTLSCKPLKGLELRHVQLIASEVCLDKEEIENKSNSENLGPITLSSLFSLELFLNISTLDLECNKLQDKGVILLCQFCLPKLNFLQRLFLASNDFGLLGLKAILDYVEGNNNNNNSCVSIAKVRPHPLEAIGLTNNPLFICESETTLLLSRLIYACRLVLRRMHMNHIQMTTYGALEILKLFVSDTNTGSLSHFPHLETIYLKQNNIDKEQFHLKLDNMGMDKFSGLFIL